MKRLARILGVIGGVGAIIWAIKDRLVSVTIPREPQLPAFRVPSSRTQKKTQENGSGDGPSVAPPETGTPSEPVSEETTEASAITDVRGIGPVYATRLEAAGITTVSDLAASRPDEVAAAAEVAETRARGWVESANDLIGT